MTPFACDRPDIVHRAVCDIMQSLFPTLSDQLLFQSGRGELAIAWLRQVAMHVSSDRLGLTREATGRFFGRDHSTITHAVQLVERACADNPVTAAFVDLVENQTRQLLDQYADQELVSGVLPFMPSLTCRDARHG